MLLDSRYSYYSRHDMNNELLLSLIRKYNQGICTPEEKAMLEAWYNAISLDSNSVPEPAAGWEQSGKAMWAQIRQDGGKPCKRPWRQVWRAAAAILLLAVGTGIYSIYLRQTAWTEVTAAAGEIRHVLLQDSSLVTLNGGATLRYASSWKPGKEREVWISGETFFEVKHLHKEGNAIIPGDRFVVHAGTMQVTVLGTSFNINTGETATSVVLESGHVRLSDAGGAFPQLDMQPGEMVILHDKELKKEKINTNIYTAWKTGRLELNKTDFADVLKFIAHNYHRKISLRDMTLRHRQLSGGTVDIRNEQELYAILSTILKINIRQEADSLVIDHQ